MEAFLNYFVYAIFFCTIVALSMVKKNKKINRHYHKPICQRQHSI